MRTTRSHRGPTVQARCPRPSSPPVDEWAEHETLPPGGHRQDIPTIPPTAVLPAAQHGRLLAASGADPKKSSHQRHPPHERRTGCLIRLAFRSRYTCSAWKPAAQEDHLVPLKQPRRSSVDRLQDVDGRRRQLAPGRYCDRGKGIASPDQPREPKQSWRPQGPTGLDVRDHDRAPSLLNPDSEHAGSRSCVGRDRTDGRRDLDHVAAARPGRSGHLIAAAMSAAPFRPERQPGRASTWLLLRPFRQPAS